MGGANNERVGVFVTTNQIRYRLNETWRWAKNSAYQSADNWDDVLRFCSTNEVRMGFVILYKKR